jgi:hypothetical protein
VVGACINSLANAVENVAFADRRDHSSTFPKGENRWMDTGERRRGALRLSLLLDRPTQAPRAIPFESHGMMILSRAKALSCLSCASARSMATGRRPPTPDS